MADRIITSLIKGVYTITLNRPEKHNCIGWEMLHGLENALHEAETKQEIKVVVIEGAGEKSFSSGADLKEFGALDAAGEKNWIIKGNQLFNRLEDLPKPTLAVLKGYVIGGGLELALSCDFRVSSETGILSFPEVSHGWLPGWGGMTRLNKLIGMSKAKAMILLSEKISATEANQLGLVTRLVAAEQLEGVVAEFANQLKEIKPITYQLAKSALQDETRKTTGSDLLFDVLALRAKDLE